MFGKSRKEAKSSTPPPLRDMALTGDLPPRPLDAVGTATVAMMEIGRPGALATVCSYVDGTTSLYTSTGGGVLGAGTDDRANAASRAFVAAVEGALGSLAVTDASPDLAEGHVRFLLRIDNTIYGVECPEDEIQNTSHPLHGLWVHGQTVLTWIRIISQERERR